eukprot:5484039-Prymnesium_polylepis.1
MCASAVAQASLSLHLPLACSACLASSFAVAVTSNLKSPPIRRPTPVVVLGYTLFEHELPYEGVAQRLS